MLVDTHSHLNFKAFDKDRDEVMKRSLDEDVFMVNVGSNYKTSKLAVEIAEKYQDGIWASVALHPIHIKDEEFDYDKFKKLAESSNKVVAIGETGLDAMYPNPNQERVFLEHLRLAKELDLPLILHCRKAHKRLIEILQTTSYKLFGFAQSRLPTVLHCFTGKWSEAKQYLNMGLYLGFNGILFKYNVEETIKKMPLEKMVIETDCPYLLPPQAKEEHKTERNEPLFVKYVAQKIAEIRSESLKEIEETTAKNAQKLFKIKNF